MHKDVLVAIQEDLRSDVARVAAEAAARAGDPAREPQIGYCLAALTAKRMFRLDPGESVRSQLAARADEIAAHLAEWATTYDAVQADLDRREITTIRRFIPLAPRDADVIDSVALRLSEVIAGAPPTAEMTLALAYEDPPPGAAYVFQSPLGAWIRLSTRPAHDARPLEESVIDPEQDDVVDILERAEAFGERQLRELVERVAEHLSTRELLASLIARADRFEVEVARMRPSSRSHSELLVRLRAEIAATADQLLREQRALRDMLAYVVLAMGSAVNVQAVAVASLRTVSIDPHAIAGMATLMRALLTDETQPTPSLIKRTRSALAQGVSRRRLGQLERLADDRTATLAGVAALLDALPPVVGDDMAAIAAALTPPSTRGIVKENRRQARSELGRVDPWFLRVFNRYTVRSNER